MQKEKEDGKNHSISHTAVKASCLAFLHVHVAAAAADANNTASLPRSVLMSNVRCSQFTVVSDADRSKVSPADSS